MHAPAACRPEPTSGWPRMDAVTLCGGGYHLLPMTLPNQSFAAPAPTPVPSPTPAPRLAVPPESAATEVALVTPSVAPAEVSTWVSNGSNASAPVPLAAPLSTAEAAASFSAFAPRVVSTEDQVLFQEAVTCARAGALRAAYIMTWLGAAEALKRRFRELGARDSKAGAVTTAIAGMEAQHQSVDARLLDEAKSYGLISDAEHAQLRHVYHMRSLFAHPYEHAPTPESLLEAGRVVIDAVLSRPTKLRHGYIADRMASVATDPHFLDDTVPAAHGYADEVFDRVADDLHTFVLTKLWKLLQPLIADPAALERVRRGRRFTQQYLLRGGAPLLNAIDWDTQLPAHAKLLAPVLATPEIFTDLPQRARGMVVSHVLGLVSENEVYLLYLDRLEDAGLLDPHHQERTAKRADAVSIEGLVAAGVAPRRYAPRIIAELKSHTWPRQNPAIKALRGAGPERIGSLPLSVQYEMGSNVLQAADGGSREAAWLLDVMAEGSERWPADVTAGVVAECFINDQGVVRFKLGHLDEALAALATVPVGELPRLLDPITAAIWAGKLRARYTDPDEFTEALTSIDAVADATTSTSAPLQRLRQALVALQARVKADWDQLAAQHRKRDAEETATP